MNKERLGEDSLRETEGAVEFAAELGADIIRCGGEVSRAEDSVARICFALGAVRAEVFGINSYISVCVKDPEGNTHTVSRRIRNRGTDLGRLERLNQLSRHICEGKIGLEDARKLFEDRAGGTSVWLTYIASTLVCTVFTLYFGGALREAIAAGIAAIVTVWLKRKAGNGFGNAVVFTFVCSVLCGGAGAVLTLIGFASDYSMIAKGDIMLLVPGVSIVCAGRDIICGELLTGLLGFIETILIALALAAGFALPELMVTLIAG